MKVSLKSLTLVGLFLFAAQAEAARPGQTFGKVSRPGTPGAVRGDCTSGMRCPCNKPKPKPGPRTEKAVVKSCEDEAMRCPCNKPKPKPGKAPVAKMMDKGCTEMAIRGCPCNKPKPKPAPRVEQTGSFKSASVADQRKQLASQVAAYMSNPCEETAMMLKSCAQMYCDRVNNQTMNKMVQELMSSTNKKAVQMKIMRTLEV